MGKILSWFRVQPIKSVTTDDDDIEREIVFTDPEDQKVVVDNTNDPYIKQLPIDEFIAVNNLDADYVRHIRDILTLTNGTWVAGGFLRNWLEGKPYNPEEVDVDFFFSKYKHYDELSMNFRSSNFYVEWSMNTGNAATLKIQSKRNPSFVYKVQLVHRKWYDSPQAILRDFDFTVCKLAMDSTYVYYGESTIEDIKNKILRVDEHSRKLNLDPTYIRRLAKYVNIYGYKIESHEITNYIKMDMYLNLLGIDHHLIDEEALGSMYDHNDDAPDEYVMKLYEKVLGV